MIKARRRSHSDSPGFCGFAEARGDLLRLFSFGVFKTPGESQSDLRYSMDDEHLRLKTFLAETEIYRKLISTESILTFDKFRFLPKKFIDANDASDISFPMLSSR